MAAACAAIRLHPPVARGLHLLPRRERQLRVPAQRQRHDGASVQLPRQAHRPSSMNGTPEARATPRTSSTTLRLSGIPRRSRSARAARSGSPGTSTGRVRVQRSCGPQLAAQLVDARLELAGGAKARGVEREQEVTDAARHRGAPPQRISTIAARP